MTVRSSIHSTAQAEKSALILDIQRASLHDGPGIRTTVFLKGCPLRCVWCHNPESQSFHPERMAGSGPGAPETRAGTSMSVEAVMDGVLADREFYMASGGGLTISGGEPMASFPFTRSLLRAARTEGIHTCLDTSGAAPTAHYNEVAPLVDLFLWDVKLSNPDHSRDQVGAPPEQLWSGLRTVGARSSIILRCPIIPGLNDNDEHLSAIARLANGIPGVIAVHLIPYHRLGRSKRERLGRPAGFTANVPSPTSLSNWIETLQSRTEKPVGRG